MRFRPNTVHVVGMEYLDTWDIPVGEPVATVNVDETLSEAKRLLELNDITRFPVPYTLLQDLVGAVEILAGRVARLEHPATYRRRDAA
jgi:CBS domain-containing protein